MQLSQSCRAAVWDISTHGLSAKGLCCRVQGGHTAKVRKHVFVLNCWQNVLLPSSWEMFFHIVLMISINQPLDPFLEPASGFEVIVVRSRLKGSCYSFSPLAECFCSSCVCHWKHYRGLVLMRLGQNRISLLTGCFPFLAKHLLVPGAFQLPKSPCYIPSL